MKRHSMIWGVMAALLLAVIACGGGRSNQPEIPPAVTPTPVQGATDIPTVEAGQSATHTVTPSPTPASDIPTLNPNPDPVRIAFEPGAISATHNGQLAAGGSQPFLINVQAGQTMTIAVESDGELGLSVILPSGQPLKRYEVGEAAFSGDVPESGDYQIRIVSLNEEGGPVSYTMTITIPPLSNTGTSSCWITFTTSLTAYYESSKTADVFGTTENGMEVLALATTIDGWVGFDPGVAQAGNVGRARLRWVKPVTGDDITYQNANCADLAVVFSYDQILNGTYTAYSGFDPGPYTLENGYYEDKSDVNSTITIDFLMVAFGDMDGDGDEDAIVALSTNTGGTGQFREFAVVLNTNGQPQHISSAFLGDRTVIEAMSIMDGILTANLIIHDEDDPLCCPSQPWTSQFMLQGGELILLDE